MFKKIRSFFTRERIADILAIAAALVRPKPQPPQTPLDAELDALEREQGPQP
jgi:hypothetical protein